MEIDISKWQGLTDWKNDVLNIEHTIICAAPDTYLLTLNEDAFRGTDFHVVLYNKDIELEPANS